MKQKIGTYKKDSLDIFMEKAGKYIKEKNNEEALKILTEAIQNHPSEYIGLPWAYLERCQLYIEMEEYDLALADINEALIIDPCENYHLLFSRIAIFEKTGKIEMAIFDYTILINSFLESFELEKSRFQRNEESFNEFKEHFASLYMERSLLYQKKGYDDLAGKDMGISIKILKYCKTISDIEQTMKYVRRL